MDKHAKIAKFLGHFMRCRGKPGNYPGVRRNKECTGDPEPAEEIMNRVTDEDQIGNRLFSFPGSLMTMVPVEKLFKGKKYRKTANQPGRGIEGRERFDAFRDHVKKCSAQEGAGRDGHKRQEQTL
jgi:hypothetical protein